jgi:hypothetical protein
MSEDQDIHSGAFQVPFPREVLHASVVAVLLVLARQLHFVFGRKEGEHRSIQLALLGLPLGQDRAASLNDPEVKSDDLGLSYEHVASTGLADALDRLYEFAFAGLLDVGVGDGDLDSEGNAAWCSRILHDLEKSTFLAEWNEYSSCKEAISRCLLVCETAQARRVLEGMDDNFMDWNNPSLKGLSMRQLALLSNMTEASLRTMTNPKRKHQLITQSDGRNAFVLIDDAKSWLKAKGRYLSVQLTNREGRLDLTRQRFSSIDALQSSLFQRAQHQAGLVGAEALQTDVARVRGVAFDLSDPAYPVLQVDDDVLLDPRRAAALGRALDLNGALLALRAKEAHASQNLREAEQGIQRLVSARAGSNEQKKDQM